MSETEEDLKATVEAITVDAQRLLAIEQEKLRLPADDPRVVPLSAESHATSKRLVVNTAVEDAVATDVARDATG